MSEINVELNARYVRESKHWGEAPKKNVYDSYVEGEGTLADHEWRVILYSPNNVTLLDDVKIKIEGRGIILPKKRERFLWRRA